MEMTHDDVRAALVGDDAVPAAARRHLTTCVECAEFARGLDRVRRTAPLLVPAGPPEGLADRVLTAVREAPAPPTPGAVVVPMRRSFGRRALTRVAVGAAATLVIGAGAAVLREQEERTPRTTLVAAAERTEAAGSAKVRVRGNATFRLPARGTTPPDFASMPVELQAHVEARWRAAMAGFEAAMRNYEKLMESLDRMFSQYPGFGFPGAPSRPPRPPRPPRATTAPTPPPTPPDLTTTVEIDASGDVAFGDRLRLNGTVGVDARSRFDLVSAREGVAVRAGGGWSLAADEVGPWAALVGAPDEIVRLVASATDVRPVAEGRYAFRVTAADGTELTGQASVSGGLLTAVDVTAAGRSGGAHWTTTLHVTISDPGAPVEPEPVRVGEVRDRVAAGNAASRVIYPFGAGLRTAR